MANWLSDYIEMTEYVPTELREQLTSIRELDLQVHNAMDELERDMKQFFVKINNLTPQERQSQFDAFLKKCDVATKAASDKVVVADKLHDLVEKSMRLLDQGLEKLKEDLLEGDKAYIVEDLERKSQELDDQLRLEQQILMHRQQQELNNRKGPGSKLSQYRSTHPGAIGKDAKSNHHSHTNHNHQIYNNLHHRHSNPTHLTHNDHHNASRSNHRSRHNSTGGAPTGPQKKREKKRINSTMTIFNRNSRSEDDSSNQASFIGSPGYPGGLPNSARSIEEISGCNSSSNSLTLKGMMTGSKDPRDTNDKTNGKDPLAGARQPILSAIDAAHAVSPNATNSDKLVLFSSNSNGDSKQHNLIHNSGNHHARLDGTTMAPGLSTLRSIGATATTTDNNNTHKKSCHMNVANQLGNHLLSSALFNSGDSPNTLNGNSSNNSISTTMTTSSIMTKSNELYKNDHGHTELKGQFSNMPLSSQTDPILMAASQAINATQNMTSGRRTSSLKASYAAVNSGRLHTSSDSRFIDQTGGQPQDNYCICKSQIQDSVMIGCDNKKCKIQWYHLDCVGISTPPEGNWYCNDCRQSLQ